MVLVRSSNVNAVEDSDNQFYTNSLQWHDHSIYNVDAWCPGLQGWVEVDAHGQSYRPCTDYDILPLTDTEVVALKRGLSVLLTSLSHRVNELLTTKGERFFRLNTRSPKDAWQILSPELPTEQQQLELLNVKTFRDVTQLIHSSRRAQEDIDEHLMYAPTGSSLKLVFQNWRPCTGSEIRCFVKDKVLVAACPIISEGNFVYTALLQRFVDALSKRVPLSTYVVDVEVQHQKERVLFIEINPFAECTDSIAFTWPELTAL